MDYITIPLSKRSKKNAGKYAAIVDSIDSDLAALNWNANIVGKNVYASRGRGKGVLLHREILSRKLGRELLPTEYVDHIDCNPLNNTRPNLRLATNSQNQANTKKSPFNTSGYKGVTWHKHQQKWQAKIQHNGKSYYLGQFINIEDAYKAYCDKAIELFGEFARLE